MIVICLLALTLFVVAACAVRDSGNEIPKPEVARQELGSYELLGKADIDAAWQLSGDVAEQSINLLPDGTEVTAIFVVEGGSAYSGWKESGKASLKDYVLTSEGRTLIDSLTARQESVFGLIEKEKLDVKVNNVYTTLFNGFAASGRIEDLRKVAELAGVTGYYVSEKYSLPENEEEEELFLSETGIFRNMTGYKGENTVVAILDTGLDYNHTAFSSEPESVLFGKEDMEAFIGASGLKGIYRNGKVAYSYDYADKDEDVFPTVGHGTHVAGIIAGNDDVIEGVAKNAQLAICKVFGDKGSAYTSDILSALSDMALMDVDVINMSLGSSAGFSRERTSDVTNEVYDALEDLGITLCVSAGNEYYRGLQGTYNASLVDSPDYGVIGSPSSYGVSLSVASMERYGENYDLAGGSHIFMHYESVDMDGNAYSFLDEILGDKNHVELEYVAVPDGGIESAYEGLDVTGKVALIQRGNGISFTEKQRIASEHGAIAAVVYNNATGIFRMQLSEKYIPSCSVTMSEGMTLLSLEDKRFEFGRDLVSDPVMSDFSSYGPLTDLTLKPEITGVGGSVLSSVIGGGYEQMSGTSMAAPNVTGVAAVMKQYLKSVYPGLTNRERTALLYKLVMSTAEVRSDVYGVPYSPRKQGAGLADLEAALTTKAYLSVTGQTKAKLELGDDPDRAGIYTLNFNLENLSEKELSYNVRAIVMTETTDDGVTIAMRSKILEGAEIKVYGNGEYKADGIVSAGAYGRTRIKVVIRLSEENKQYIDELFPDGMYVDGFIGLESLDEEENDLSIPYLVFYGDWSSVNVFDKNYYDEEEAQIYKSVPLAVYQNSHLLPLGEYQYILPSGAEKPEASYEKIAVSPDGLAGIYSVYMGLLSNAKEVEYIITDDVTGDVVFSLTDYNVRKAMFSTNQGQIIPSYSLINANINDVAYNNRTYTFTVRVTKDYFAAEAQEWSFPIFFDSTAPVLTDKGAKVDTVDGRTYLTVNVYDNHYLSNVRFYDIQGTEAGGALSATPIPVYEFNKGEDNELVYDITDYMDKLSEGKIVVYLEDYAMNYNAYAVSVIDLYKDYDMDGDKIVGYRGEGGDLSVPAVGEVADNAFKGNENITSLSFTDGLKKIGSDAFADMKVLKSAEFPESLEKVGTGAFTGLSVLSEIRFNGTKVPEFGENVFGIPENAVIYVPAEALAAYKEALPAVKEQIKEIPNVAPASDFTVDGEGTLVAYKGKGGTVIIPDNLGIVKLGSGAFANNVNIVDVVLPEGLTFIETRAFADCVNLETVSLPSTLASYTYEMFKNCVSLVSLTMNSATLPSTWGPPMFLWSFNITPYLRIYVPEGTVETWKGFAVFSRIADRVFEIGTEVRGFVVEDGTLTRYWDTDKNVIIPDGVKVISEGVFTNNVKLENVTLPSTVETIGCRAFAKTTALHGVVIPASVSEIGEGAFDGSSLEVATVYGQPASIGAKVFGEGVKAIYVEETQVDAYKSSWSDYAGKILDLGIFSIEGTLITEYKGSSENVIIPAGLNIGANSFKGKNVSSVYAANGLDSIGDGAFSDIVALEIELPESVSRIGDEAFKGSKVTLTLKGGNPAEIGSDVFELSNGTLIYVEDAYYAEYAEKWSEYLSVIHKSSELIVEFEIADGVLVGYNGLGGEVVVPDGVTAIADSVFAENKAITSVILPEGLTSIGAKAFDSCFGLVSVRLPSTLESMGNSAFSACRALETINIEDTRLTVIPSMAFINNRSLLRIVLPETCVEVNKYAFENAVACEELILNEGLVSIMYHGFASCGASELNLPSTLTTLEGYAFYHMDNVKEVFLPKSLKLARNSDSALCFADMKSLEKVVCEEGLTVICSQMFSGDVKLTEINFPSSLELLSFNAFSGCDGLTEIDLSATKITEILSDTFLSCPKLSKILLPEGVNSIGKAAFRGCVSLKELVLPAAVESIEGYAFSQCSSLRSINLGETALKTVGDNAFEGCAALGEIILPETISSVGSMAFANSSVKRVSILASTVPSVGANAFPTEGIVIYVLAGMKEKYLEKTAWTAYADCIFDLGDVFVMNGTTILGYVGNGGEVVVPGGISGIGEGAFAGSEITGIILPYGLTEIGSKAFENCTFLTSVVINEGIKTIGSRAFAGSGLEEITIYAENAPEVADDAFEGCESFKANVSEGTTEEYAAMKAFENANLVELGFVIENGVLVQYIGKGGNVVVPDGVTEIKGGVFSGNDSLISVVIPEGVRILGDGVFSDSKNLVSVIMPDSVVSVGSNCFNGCVSLSELRFSANVRVLTTGLIENCTSLRSFEISSEVNSVQAYAMRNSGVIELIVPETVTDIAYYAFYGMYSMKVLEVYADVPYLHCTFANATALEECYFYGDVGTIQGWDFASAPDLKVVEFHGDVESVGLWSETSIDIMYGEMTFSFIFANCNSLERVEFFGNVGIIGGFAFNSCAALSDVIFHGDLGGIDGYAFSNCPKLTGFRVSDDNEYLALDANGLLYSGDFSRLYRQPEFFGFEGKLVIDESCIIVDDYALSHNSLYLLDLALTYEGWNITNSQNFNVNDRITGIVLSANLRSIGKGAFAYLGSLEEVTVSDGIHGSELVIGEYAFAYTTALRSAEIPENTVEIGNYAFISSGIENIDIPASVRKMSFALVFSGCDSLKSVSVAETNETYAMEDGFLFGRNDGVLYFRMKDDRTELVIPEGIRVIGANIFANDKNLVKVTLPSTLEVIGDKAFYGTTNLKTYIFLGEAPVLESSGKTGRLTFANFFDYMENMSGVRLTLIAKNLKGFDTYIWRSFFADMIVG